MGKYNVGGTKEVAAFSAVALAGNSSTQSAAISGMGNGSDMSLSLRVTGAGADVTWTVQCRIAGGTTYVTPETGGTIIANVTDQLDHIASVTIPLCDSIKITATTNTGTAVTVDATLRIQ